MQSTCVRSLLVILLAVFSPALHAQKITNPKASFLDVAARRAFLQSTTDPRIREAIAHLHSCVATPVIEAPQGEMIIPHHYLQDSHGPINPAEAEATRVYSAFENRIAAGMDRWVATGDEAEAKCALDQLDQWAQAKALLNYDRERSSQAWYQVEWTLSCAGITTSVLAQDTTLNAAEFHRITAWLDKAAQKDISFEKPTDTQNNHHYWRALAATSIGVAAGDNSLFRFGVDTYKSAIHEIDANGAFPKEMARHEYALHYQAFALDPLIFIAAFAQRQGLDLYAYSAHGRSLRDAVMFLGRALGDPSLIKTYTPEEQIQDSGPGTFDGIDLFAGQFGKANLPPALQQALTQPTYSAFLAGSATVLGGK